MGLMNLLFGKMIDRRIAAYQNDLITKHCDEVQNIYKTMRGWRHDFHNHIQTLIALSNNAEKTKEYMSIFSVVFQDFKLFSFSLGQNVAASENYDEAHVKHCLQEAGFGNRLSEMPEGLNTCLYKNFDENGVEISGGEAQKIAIARALYKNAPFIVLDEPTAALDPLAEYEIYSKFNEIVQNKTAIFISHRLSSCRFCNKIAVFDKGQIVQQGSHEELVADESGKYHELWYAQAQYYNT